MSYEKFNYEEFDYEKSFKEVKDAIKKPNILICGATGVGKSSLINDIFDMNEENGGAVVGNNGRPETRGIKEYTSANATVNLFDSEGYEVGKVGTQKDEYYKNIISCIDQKRKEFPSEMEKHIHEVWYCVSAGNKKFFDVDKDLINTINHKNVPVMILLTKVDLVDEKELDDLMKEIHNNVPSVNCYTYSTEIPENEVEIRKKYVQKSQIIKWAIDNLDGSLKLGFIPAIRGGIEEKRRTIIKEYIPMYTGIVATTVLGTSFVPVPFSDSVPLMGIQIKMSMSIISAYGIKTNAGKVVTDIVGTSLVSYLGKTLASQILSLIPWFGSGIKAAVNVSVAASVTAILGAAIAVVSEQYLKACVDKGGAENLPFTEFLSKERLNEALSYVKSNQSEFNIENIVESIVKQHKQK